MNVVMPPVTPEKRANSLEAGHLPPGLALYARLVTLFTALPLLYLFELYVRGEAFLAARLWSVREDRFGDFWHYRALLGLLHQADFFAARDRFAYPAPCAILYQGLYHLGTHPHASFNAILWATETASCLFLAFALRKVGLGLVRSFGLVLLMGITSHPWHTLYDRGNIELFIYVFIATGVWAWLTGRQQLAAILWGVAAAMKIYPILLFGVFLSRGCRKNLALGLATFAGVLFFSFWYVGPSIKIAANGTMWGIRGFVGTYGAHTRYGELVWDHSFLAAIKEILTLPLFHSGDRQIALSHIYEALVVLAGPPLFFLWRRKAPALNQLCVLLLLMIVLPPVSYDYTLIHSYLVMGIVFTCYVDAVRHGRPFTGIKTFAVCFALICTSETWINLVGFQPNGVLKAAALIVSIVLLGRYPLRNPLESLTLERPDTSLARQRIARGEQIAHVS